MFIFASGLFAQIETQKLSIFNGDTVTKSRSYYDAQTDTLGRIDVREADSAQVLFTFKDSVAVKLYIMIGMDGNAATLGGTRLDSVKATSAKVISYTWKQLVTAAGVEPVQYFSIKLAFESTGNASDGNQVYSAYSKTFTKP